jgi:threonine synthase
MRYVSTRGGDVATFADAISRGYARDGGLYMPEHLPQVSLQELQGWKHHNFAMLCEEIMVKFVGNEIPRADLRQLITRCFGTFSHDAVVPLTHLPGADDIWVAELFHGPSLSFKDFGLQVLCSLLDYFARRRNRKVSLLVCTTGDTGPAAICAASGLSSLQLCVSYPIGQISRIQELQMTTVQAENVHVFAFEGGGDDMDAPVKALSIDQAFQQEHGISSVNSVNIGRVIVQTVHYFWSYLRAVEGSGEAIGAPVQFALPCGALGNSTAGLLAKKMGLPVSNILCGTNVNDIFHRAVALGDFSREAVMHATLSEAINIQVPYNFERILYLISDADSARVCACMKQLEAEGRIDLAEIGGGGGGGGVGFGFGFGALLQQHFVSTKVWRLLPLPLSLSISLPSLAER